MAISLTEKAASHVQSFLAKRGKGVGLRVGVRTTGCSGLAYKLEFVDAPQAEDLEFESHGVKVLVDPKSLQPCSDRRLLGRASTDGDEVSLFQDRCGLARA